MYKERRHFTYQDVASSIKWAKDYTEHLEHRVHELLTPYLNDTKIVMIQIYGSGDIDQNESVTVGGFTGRVPGPCQMAVAMKLCDRYTEQFDDLKLFAQEPTYSLAEVAFLRDNDIVTSTNDYFNRALVDHISNLDDCVIQSKIIVIMIRPVRDMLAEYMIQHFDILERIIFVSYHPFTAATYQGGGSLYYFLLSDYAQHAETPVELIFEDGTLGRDVFGDGESWIYSITNEKADELRAIYIDNEQL